MQCPWTFDHRESIIITNPQYLLYIDKSSDPQACSAIVLYSESNSCKQREVDLFVSEVSDY